MPIEVGIWRLGKDKPEKVEFSSIDSEARLEKTIVDDLSILAPGLMLVGQQVITGYGNRIDLLAMNSEGHLVVLELKRNRTPREVVAQTLDYASWVKTLSYDEIAEIFADNHEGKEFEEGFDEFFDTNPPEKLNQEHELIIVASDLDPSTERIIDYLSEDYGVPINAVFFRYFKDGENEYLTRSWLIDPMEVETKPKKARRSKTTEPWNGRDHYVALGDDEARNWDDCVKYGFVAGGGGRWYSRSLYTLNPGARIFACIPKIGYVGVGVVRGGAMPVEDFRVDVDGHDVPLLECSLSASNMDHHHGDLERCEHVVPIKWQTTLKREEAYWEKGMFANQNTACKLRNQFTLERLIKRFDLEE